MKILVVTLSNLGDVVLTLPVFQALSARYPDASLDVLVGASGRIVFEDDTRLRRVTVVDKKAPLSAKMRLLADIRREHYDILIDLRYSLIGLLGGAKKRNPYLVRLSRRGHRAFKHLEALRGLVPMAEAESFLEGVSAFPIEALPAAPRVVAAVGSKSDLKKWPAEKYAQALTYLAREKNCSIILVGDKADTPDALRVVSLMGRVPVQDLTGRTNFRQLVSVLRDAALVLTNDSAPLHIADSLKVPVLAVFGPSDPSKYGPRGPAGLAVSKKLFCQPCERAQCRYGHECLKELDAAQVCAEAERLLEGKKRSGSPRILVIRLDRIGDLMLSLPAIEALRRRFPDARISLMTRPATRTLLEGHPAIDEVIAYDYKGRGRHAFGRGYFRFLEEISKRRFDAAVILHPGIRSYLIPFLAGIPVRVGYRTGQHWLLTKKTADERRLGLKHESEYAMEVASVLIGTRVEARPSKLEVGTALLPELSKGKWLAVHAGASCPSKRWPAERFGELVAALAEEYPRHHIGLVGGPETVEISRKVAQGGPERLEDLTGRLDLRQLTAFLSRCDALISNDSGPVHVAAAVGTPVVDLFGRNQAGLSPQRWRPLGEGHVVIQKDVGCQVCLAHECPIEFECLKAITVDEVMTAVRGILAEPMKASR